MSFAFSQPGELTPSATQFHFAVKRRIGTPTFMCRDLTYALMIQAIRVGHGLQRFSVEDLPHYFFVSLNKRTLTGSHRASRAKFITIDDYDDTEARLCNKNPAEAGFL